MKMFADSTNMIKRLLRVSVRRILAGGQGGALETDEVFLPGIAQSHPELVVITREFRGYRL